MKKLMLILVLGIIINGCSLLNTGYISSEPDMNKLVPFKSNIKDVTDILGEPAIYSLNMGEKEITHKYYYNTPNASVDTMQMMKGDYKFGCQGCGEIITTLVYNDNNKDYLLKGLSVSNEYINNILIKASKLMSEKKYSEAFPLFLEASHQHSTIAQYTVGLMYIKGDGVNKDYTKAKYWFEQSAFSNFPPALYDLGAIYHNGEGINVDINKAVLLYEKSANLGYPNAMRELVKIYKIIGKQDKEKYWSNKLETLSLKK